MSGNIDPTTLTPVSGSVSSNAAPAAFKDALISATKDAPELIKNAAKNLPWYWLRDDSGRSSITATIVWIAFLCTTVVFVTSHLPTFAIHGKELAFKAFDVAGCTAYLGPILMLYGGRKLTDRHYDSIETTAQAK